MKDSYLNFFAKGYISKEQFFEFGLSETIYVDFDKAAEKWEQLKLEVLGNKQVFIRGFGRDAQGTHLFQTFYRYLFGNYRVEKDKNNNAQPTKLIREWTGYSKAGGANYQPIRNYQIAHVFGRTKNPYCFCAPWNIVYIPKLVDPLTGHESKGDYTEEFQKLFQKQCYERFSELIDDYNSIISNSDLLESVETAIKLIQVSQNLDDADIQKFRSSLQKEFEPISVA